jgi:hypothetical protein
MRFRLLFAIVGWMAVVGGASSAPADDAVRRQAARLLAQLGDPSFQTREQATRELAALGPAARPVLESGLKHPDAEVRNRCQRVLAVIVKAEYQARLEAFAADAEDRLRIDLPGWKRFREMIGDDPLARSLFVDMHRTEPELLHTLEANLEAAASLLNVRCQELYQGMYGIGGTARRGLGAGAVAALLFCSADPNVKAGDQAVQYLGQNFIYQPAFRSAATDGPKAEAFRKLLAAWIENASESAHQYYAVRAALVFNLSQGIKPALGLLDQPALQQPPSPSAPWRVEALLCVGRYGDKSHLDKLSKALRDEAAVYTQRIDDKLLVVQVRDVALAVSVHLAGHDLKEFGFTRVETHAQRLFAPESLSFDNDEQRTAALKKWADLQGRATNPG